MIHLSLLSLCYLAAVLQTTLAPRLELGGIGPDFFALALVAALIAVGGRVVFAWTAIVGLLGDCLGSGPIGGGVIVCTLLALPTRRWSRIRLGDSAVSIALLTFALAFGFAVARVAVHRLHAHVPLDSTVPFTTAFGTASYTTLVAFCAASVGNRLRTALRPSQFGRLARSD